MRLIPLAEFYMRRHLQINALIERLSASGALTSAALEILQAVVPILIRRWPQLNENGIMEDAVETLTEAFRTDSDKEDALKYPDGRVI